MRRHPDLFVVVLLCVSILLSACGGGDEPPSDPTSTFTLTTDRSAYVADCTYYAPHLRCSFTVKMTYHNRTEAPVYLERCYPDSEGPIYGVRTTDRTEEAAYSPNWACVGHDNRIRVDPGETRVDVFEITGPNGWDGRTGEPFGVTEGTFQIEYLAYPCTEEIGCERLPEAQRLSAPFSVTTN